MDVSSQGAHYNIVVGPEFSHEAAQRHKQTRSYAQFTLRLLCLFVAGSMMNDFMARVAKILNVDPAYAIAAGEIMIDCEGFDTSDSSRCAVTIGDAQAPIVALSPRRVLVIVPETKGGRVEVRLWSGDESSEAAYLTVAKKLAGDLHPVANPAFDPDDGALFVTRSGSRGEELPVTLFRIDISGDVSEYSGDIPNPTGIAFGNDGQMFVSSRLEGIAYKITPFK